MSSYDAAIRNNIRDPFYRDKHETARRKQLMERQARREAEDAMEKAEEETWRIVPGESSLKKGGKSKKQSQKNKRKTLRKRRKSYKK
jgi:hypothetical protein